MGVLTARPPVRRIRRLRGPVAASLAVHAAALGAWWAVGAVEGGPRTSEPACAVFVLSVPSAPSEPVDVPQLEFAPPAEPPDVALPLAIEMPPPEEPPTDLADVEVPLETSDPTSKVTVATLAARVPSRRPPAAVPPSPPPPPLPAAPPHAVERPVAAAQPARPAQAAVDAAVPFASNRPPVYPEAARRAGWTGVVTLRLDVDAVGHVRTVSIVASSGVAVLDAAAVEAASAWRFTPARTDGVPTASTVLRRVRFVLDG